MKTKLHEMSDEAIALALVNARREYFHLPPCNSFSEAAEVNSVPVMLVEARAVRRLLVPSELAHVQARIDRLVQKCVALGNSAPDKIITGLHAELLDLLGAEESLLQKDESPRFPEG